MVTGVGEEELDEGVVGVGVLGADAGLLGGGTLGRETRLGDVKGLDEAAFDGDDARELGLGEELELDDELELDELDELAEEPAGVGAAPESSPAGVAVGSPAVGVNTIEVPLGGPDRRSFLLPPATATAAMMRMIASTPAAMALALILSGLRRAARWPKSQ